MKRILSTALLATVVALPVVAQTRAEKLAEIKEFVEGCGSTDVAVASLYISEAFSLGAEVKNPCYKAALSSDNADVKGLATRGLLAEQGQIVIELEMPPEYQKKRAALLAKSDDDGLEQLDRDWSNYVEYYRRAGGTITLKSFENSGIESATSVWIGKDYNGAFQKDSSVVSVSVSNKGFGASGQIYGLRGIAVILDHQGGGLLIGEAEISGYGPYPARINLF